MLSTKPTTAPRTILPRALRTLAIGLALTAAPALFGQNLPSAKRAAPVDKSILAIVAKAEAGDPSAQLELGDRYSDGSGVQKDAAEAVKWYRKAAEKGSTEGQRHLAVSLFKGIGVPKNNAEAIKWARKVAEKGDLATQVLLWGLYTSGDTGVTQNDVEATKWCRKAALQGDADAQMDLGARYVLGKGVEKNVSEGYVWSSIATANGKSEASRIRAITEKHLTPQDLKQAQARAQKLYADIQANTKH
jgi:hypothetical protein